MLGIGSTGCGFKITNTYTKVKISTIPQTYNYNNLL